MIESLVLDELREQAAEAVALGQFKTPGLPAADRIERALSQAARPQNGRRGGGLSPERARLMEQQAAEFDAQLSKGEAEV